MLTLILALTVTGACPPDALCREGMVCVKYVKTADHRTITTCMTPEELAVYKQVQRARRQAAKEKADKARKAAEEAAKVTPPPPAPVVPVVEEKVVEVPPPAPAPAVVKQEVTVVVEDKPVAEKEHDWNEKRWLVVGGRLSIAGGYGIHNMHLSGLASVRVKSVPLHLGVEGFYAFPNYGWGVQGLAYTFDNGVLAHHLDLGIMWTQSNLLSTFDVPRARDLIFGTGLEWRFHPNMSLTVDWRASMPDPHYVATHHTPVHDAAGNQVYGNAGRYLDLRNVVGNTFGQSQVLIGLMIHN